MTMVHNHPREKTLFPSPADLDLTNHMYQVGKFLNLPVIDHFIINEKEFVSVHLILQLRARKSTRKGLGA